MGHEQRFGATILDPAGLRLTSEEKALFRDTRPFGFILFARNIESHDQTRALCEELREAAGHDCLITIDQEGGRVQRLRLPLARQWKPALDHVAAAGGGAERAMYLRGRLIAHELAAIGIDSNCAPLGDVITEDTHPFLKNRAYGSEAATVARLARATAQGHLDGGVLPVMKHMPGHGRATDDSHFDLPTVRAGKDELLHSDFAVFHDLKDLPLGMTGHMVFSALDPRPTTLSPVMIDVIRCDIGFDGFLMTDDCSMKALSGGPAEVSRAAIAAGVDAVLYCNAPLEVRAAVAEAAGEMSEAAQARAERVFAARGRAMDLDTSAAEDELAALMGGDVYG